MNFYHKWIVYIINTTKNNNIISYGPIYKQTKSNLKSTKSNIFSILSLYFYHKWTKLFISSLVHLLLDSNELINTSSNAQSRNFEEVNVGWPQSFASSFS